MKARLLRLSAAVAIVAANSSVVSADDALSDYANTLNNRIVLAAADGREWPKYSGGLAAFLFDQDYVMEPGVIIFRDTRPSADDHTRWFEATVRKIPDGTWRIGNITLCDDSRAKEAIEQRDRARERSVQHCKFDYVEQGPLELLELLKEWNSQYWMAPILPFGWVKERDLPALIDLLDSPEPCANVQSMLSSLIDARPSTVGNEAAYLIEGFRKDYYPPRLNSTRPFCDVQEIKQWWEKRQGSQGSDPKLVQLASLPEGLAVVHTPDPVMATSFGPTGAQWTHSTTVSSAVGPVTILEFGFLLKRNGQWTIPDWSQAQFSASEFAERYGCPGAVLKPGESYTEVSNRSVKDCLPEQIAKWYFIGLDSQGNRVKGEAEIKLLAEFVE